MTPALFVGVSEPRDAGAARNHSEGETYTANVARGAPAVLAVVPPTVTPLLDFMRKCRLSCPSWNAPLGTPFFDFFLIVLVDNAWLSDLHLSL